MGKSNPKLSRNYEVFIHISSLHPCMQATAAAAGFAIKASYRFCILMKNKNITIFSQTLIMWHFLANTSFVTDKEVSHEIREHRNSAGRIPEKRKEMSTEHTLIQNN